MEAIGQLAGGIAHDFNNILQAMQGYCRFLLESLDPNSEEYEFAEEIHSGSERAASLTRQLLAFSRRQVLEQKDLELNDLIQNLLKMIGRILGEHIELKFSPSHQILNIRADPGQIEQVLINLCVNSRDAMPEGGVLSIETDTASFNEDDCENSVLGHTWPICLDDCF